MKTTTKQRLSEALQQADSWNLKGEALLSHLMVYAKVNRETAIRFKVNQLRKASPNKHKLARKLAEAEALKQNLDESGKKMLFKNIFRRFANRFFPKFRKRYADALQRWKKANVKRWARNIYASLHDRDIAAMATAKKKISKQRVYRTRHKAELEQAKVAKQEKKAKKKARLQAKFPKEEALVESSQ